MYLSSIQRIIGNPITLRSSTYQVPFQVWKSPTSVPAPERCTACKILSPDFLYTTLRQNCGGSVCPDIQFKHIFPVPCDVTCEFNNHDNSRDFLEKLQLRWMCRKSTVPVLILSWNNLHHLHKLIQWATKTSGGSHWTRLVILCVYVHKTLDDRAKLKVH